MAGLETANLPPASTRGVTPPFPSLSPYGEGSHYPCGRPMDLDPSPYGLREGKGGVTPLVEAGGRFAAPEWYPKSLPGPSEPLV